MSDRDDPPRRIISVIGPHSGCGKSTLICHILNHIPGLGCLKISPRAEWPVPPAGERRAHRHHCDIVKPAVIENAVPDTDRFVAAGAAQVEWLQYDWRDFGAGQYYSDEGSTSLHGNARWRPRGAGDAPEARLTEPWHTARFRRPPRGAAATERSDVWSVVESGRPPRGAAATPDSPESVLADAFARFPAGMVVITEGTAAVKYALPAAVILVTSPTPREMKPACQAVLSRVTDLVIDGTAEKAKPRINDHLRWMYPELRPRFTWAADLAREAPPIAFFDRLRGLIEVFDSK